MSSFEQQVVKSPINSSSTVLIVGGSRGIGLEFARQCAARGARVIATERTPSKFRNINGVTVLKLDVSQPASCKALGVSLKGERLSHVIQNAGIMGKSGSISTMTLEDMSHIYSVNTIGAICVLQAVQPLMKQGAIWAIISSKLGSISMNDSGRTYSHRARKAALNMIGSSVAFEFRGMIGVVCLHPGWVGTDMNGGSGYVGIGESITGMIAAIENTDANSKYRFVRWNREMLT